MSHVRQTDLIRLAANELAGPQRDEVERHLAACAACRAFYQQQLAVWRALGEWQLDLTEGGLSTGIEWKLTDRPVVRHPFWAGVTRFSRIAAAIVVGVGAGYWAARTSSPEQPDQTQTVSATDDAIAGDALGEMLGIDYVADASPAGLFLALDDITSEGSES
jgi:hypothetical protein